MAMNEMEEAPLVTTGNGRNWPQGGEPLGEYEEIELHGHRVSFQAAGSGDQVVFLLHGITSTAEAWREVMPRLAERYTVIAPE